MIPLTPVANSSAIAAQGYDPVSGVLRVQYTSGAVHDFKDVSPEDAAGLASADSAGRYLSSTIRPAYESERVIETDDAS